MSTLTVLSQLEKIEIPRFEQKQRLWCGPASLQSLLAFNGSLVSQEEIVKFIDMIDGCFIQDLGLFALSKNFEVKISSYDMIYIDPTWSSLKGTDMVEKVMQRVSLTRPSKTSKRFYTSLIEYISKGGDLSISLPKKDEIISTLKSGVPILVIVNSNSLYNRARLDQEGRVNDIAGSAGGHFLLLSGYKNGYFTVIDPAYENPLSIVQEDRLMFALSLWGGWMMSIHEKT